MLYTDDRGPASAVGREPGGALNVMRARRTAAELEARAARAAPPGAVRPPLSEPLAMLRRRGLDPRPSRPDLPFAPEHDPVAVGSLVERLRHYAFRLFLRGAILRGGGFTPGQATRYVPAENARAMAEALVALGMAAPLARGRYRLLHRPRTFGGTLEWWLAEELRARLALEVATGVRSGAPGVGGDLDVVAAGEGKLVYLEVKSSPPKHVTPAEVGAFLRRIAAVRPDVALFVVDTALRLGDKIVPMFDAALVRGGDTAQARRLFRETWAFGPHVFAVNAREDLVDNVCRAIAEGIRALAPPLP